VENMIVKKETTYHFEKRWSTLGGRGTMLNQCMWRTRAFLDVRNVALRQMCKLDSVEPAGPVYLV